MAKQAGNKTRTKKTIKDLRKPSINQFATKNHKSKTTTKSLEIKDSHSRPSFVA
jgi:hypothetical protein